MKMTSKYKRLEDGFSILKWYGGKEEPEYHLQYYVTKDGKTFLEYRNYPSFEEAFAAYEEMRTNEQTV